MFLRSSSRTAALLGVTALGLVFGGCASAPSVDLDAARKSSIKSIAVLGIAEPAEVQLTNLGGTAGAFGLIGGLVQASANTDHAKQLTAALKDDRITFAPALVDSVENALRRDGYNVVDARDQRAKLAADKKSDDFSDVHVNADAILAIGYGTIGYVSEPMSLDYQPWLMIKTRLIDAQTKKDLYYKVFLVGWKLKIENVVYFPADPKYRYRTYDAVIKQVREAATGLMESQAMVASRIGQDLAGNSAK